MNSMDINEVERTLRRTAAEKAVAQADKYGWTEVRRDVYLDTADRLKAFGHDVSAAPYWMTTQDGTPPRPIRGADDPTLRAMVDVDRDLTRAAKRIDEMDRQAAAGRGLDLASADDYLAWKSRGRAL
ncbi:hypothetical protein [Pseudomonas sp. Hp2]|uniref:hypothetical protein n=1 Tax=Pseudomonas sp. Hp2 TaxID=701189 RepID=UPI0011266AAE|nr:hypothetical protein [Pseudomonas sp. Hp2]